MSEHDWHNFPASGAPYLICWNCELVWDFEDNEFYAEADYSTPIKDDPGCSPHSERGGEVVKALKRLQQ